MSNLTNLLPPERKRALSRGFLLRVGVVAIVLVITLVASAGVLLVPTYMLLVASEKEKEVRLAGVEAKLAASEESDLPERLKLLSTNVTKLVELSKAPSTSAKIRSILELSRPGITLSNLSYTSTEGEMPATLVVGGSSLTREALRNYQVTLQNVPSVESATLPVSAYANDADIRFSITITFKP
jgi:hypothetical protein